MNKVGQIMRTCWKELIIALFMVFVGYELHATRSELRSIKQDVSSTNQALTSRFWDRPSMEAAPHPIKWDMSSIGTDVSSTSKADINSINSQAGSMQSDVSSIKRDVSAIRRDLGAIKTDLSNQARRKRNQEKDWLLKDMQATRADGEESTKRVCGPRAAERTLRVRAGGRAGGQPVYIEHPFADAPHGRGRRD